MYAVYLIGSGPVEDLPAVHVRERDLGGRHHVQIPVAGDLEEVRLELRQVAGSGQRCAVHHERRLDLGVAMVGRVQVQHEVDQRACEPRTCADQHREPGARDLRAALEVDDAERRAKVPMRLRVESKLRGVP